MRDIRPRGRVDCGEREASERKCDFDCMECSMTDEEVAQEADGACAATTSATESSRGGVWKNGKYQDQRYRYCRTERQHHFAGRRRAGIPIPHLCYLRDINEIGACRICVVEVEGTERLVPACNTRVVEGMSIHTNTPRVREARKTNLRLILSQHNSTCTTCHPQRKLRAAKSGPLPEHPLPALSGEAGAEPAGHGRSRDSGGQ